jgi:hypothetical protein
MGVRIDEFISLPKLKNLELVGGSKGICKIARWVHVMESPELLEFVQNDELIIVTGVLILDNRKIFIELVNGLIDKRAAGLIVNIGKYIMHVPEYIIELADEKDFPIFELPWKVSLAEVTEIICSEIVKRHLEEISYQDMLMNIIFFNKISFEDFSERVSSYGYNSFNSFRIVIVTIDKFPQYLLSNNIKDEQSVSYVKDNLLRSVNSAIWDSICRPISFLQNHSVVFLLVNEKEKATNLKVLTNTIRENCKNNFPNITVSIGFGNIYFSFSEIKKSYIEADKTLKVLKAEGKSDSSLFYQDMGVYKLLSEIENVNLLREYYDDTIGILEQYDAQNRTELSHVLFTFLKEDCNYIQASVKLYLHRNTLMYKINKIQKIINRDLSDTKVKMECYLAYLVKQINDF